MDSELKHYGVKGMKWGVRRYQNEDGSYTAAGKKRYSRDNSRYQSKQQKRKERADRAFSQTVKSGKDKAPVSPAEKIAGNVRKSTEDASKITRSVSRIKNRNKKQDFSHLSDKELKDRVDRLAMEKRYRDLLSDDKTYGGKDWADDLLDIVGGVAGITGSVVGTYALIRTIRG